MMQIVLSKTQEKDVNACESDEVSTYTMYMYSYFVLYMRLIVASIIVSLAHFFYTCMKDPLIYGMIAYW